MPSFCVIQLCTSWPPKYCRAKGSHIKGIIKHNMKKKKSQKQDSLPEKYQLKLKSKSDFHAITELKL